MRKGYETAKEGMAVCQKWRVEMVKQVEIVSIFIR